MKMFKIILAVTLVLGTNASASAETKGASDQTAGARIFNANCIRCHPNGGNVIIPNMPLAGSSKLHSFKTFLGWIRNPVMPDGSEGAMPSFSKKQISDQEARTLYHYIISMQTAGPQSGGYGPGYGMGGYGGGSGMGPGRMGGYGGGYGPGMMGGYGAGYGGSYGSAECRKFLDATAGLRKELSDKRFEYSEAYRNPKANQETILRLEGEISDLQDEIAGKAPLGCGW